MDATDYDLWRTSDHTLYRRDDTGHLFDVHDWASDQDKWDTEDLAQQMALAVPKLRAAGIAHCELTVNITDPDNAGWNAPFHLPTTEPGAYLIVCENDQQLKVHYLGSDPGLLPPLMLAMSDILDRVDNLVEVYPFVAE